jgi:hypothetical protein
MDEIIEKEQKSIKKVDSDIDPYEYEDAMEYEERLKQLLKRRKEKKTITK